MSKTLYDKCWFIDKISENIDTIVDFGCAGGDLAVMISRICPECNFKYIGIDSNDDLLYYNNRDKFKSLNVSFHKSIDESVKNIDTSKSVLVLNSVLHEIFSYLSEAEQFKLLKKFFNSGFKYIAIRDMHMPTDKALLSIPPDIIGVIRNSKYAEQWNEFNTVCDRRDYEFEDIRVRVYEFFLKYFYVENWERECKEQYLWNIIAEFAIKGCSLFFKNYDIIYENSFHIPYVADKIYKDFGIKWQYNTHKKMLFKTREVPCFDIA